MKRTGISKQKWPHLLVIVISFGLLTTFLLHRYGIKVVNDSHRYLEYADGLRDGFYVDPHNFWYISYAYFLLTVRLFTASPTGIVAVQVAISLGGVLALRQAVLLMYNKEITATLASLLYMGFIETLSWNNYVLTESLYLSGTCFTLWLLARMIYAQNQKQRWYLLIPVLVFTCLLKPTGIALAGAIAVSAGYKVIGRLQLRYRWLVTAGLAILFLIAVNTMLGTFQVVQDYARGEIIYDITTLPNRPEYRTLHIDVPADLFLPSPSLPPLTQIVSFVFHNPVFWLKLFFAKLFYFVIHVRPFWSWAHNAYVLLFLLPTYTFAIYTLIRERLPPAVRLFCWTYIGLHVLSVCLTSVDWDGRFLMPVLPVLFLLAVPRITGVTGQQN